MVEREPIAPTGDESRADAVGGRHGGAGISGAPPRATEGGEEIAVDDAVVPPPIAPEDRPSADARDRSTEDEARRGDR